VARMMKQPGIPSNHPWTPSCTAAGCTDIDTERFPVQFTIEISYQTGSNAASFASSQPGWKYTLTWSKPDSTTTNVERGYGYATAEAAKAGAEAKATAIAKSLQPALRYVYTPEV
jgi:hypothetical protein